MTSRLTSIRRREQASRLRLRPGTKKRLPTLLVVCTCVEALLVLVPVVFLLVASDAITSRFGPVLLLADVGAFWLLIPPVLHLVHPRDERRRAQR
jgi:hypothetical protein